MRHIPSQTDPSVGLLRNMSHSFALMDKTLMELTRDSQGRSGLIQRNERPQHTPSQTDPTVGSSFISICSLWRS